MITSSRQNFFSMPKRSRTLAFRTGQINAAGGRPIDPRTIKHRSVVSSQWIASTVTAGDHMTFRVNNFNVPLEMASTTTFANAGSLSNDRHPSGHVELVEDNYDTYQVLSSHYRWELDYMGGLDETEDIIFAWKFDGSSQSTNPAVPATAASTEVWHDIQASPGWTWRRFTKNYNTPRPSGGVININIPSCYDLIKSFKTGSTTQFEYPADYRGVLADSTAAPVAQCILHVCVFTIATDGIPAAHVVGEIMLSCRCTMTVLVNKFQDTSEIVDIGDDGP